MLPAMASGVPCGLLGDCARFDTLAIHVGAALGLAQSPTKSFSLLGCLALRLICNDFEQLPHAEPQRS